MKKVAFIILSLTVCFFLSTQAANTKNPTKKQNEHKSVNLKAWQEMGPDNIGGRTNAILIDKDNSLKIYAGSAGGGLWLTTSGGAVWKRITTFPEIAISSIVQSDNGTVFVGTGEGLNPNFSSPGVLYPFGSYRSYAAFGMKGTGIYKSVNDSFVQLPATANWEEINDLVYSSTNNTLYAATDYGLQVSTDNGNTWTLAKTSSNQNLDLIGTDLAIASDGSIVYVQRDRSSRRGTAYFSDGSSTTNFKVLDFPIDAGCMAFAFAPSDPSYIYASVADLYGDFLGIYQSKNQGDSFRVIVPGGSTLIDVFNGSGDYCNNIAVLPNNPKHILVGGYPSLWEGVEISESSFFGFNSMTSFSGVQTIVFDSQDSNTLFVGSNIGIAKGRKNGNYFQFNLMNKNYGTAQYTTLSCSNDDQILGGTRESGALFITKDGNTQEAATQLTSGYASQTALSMINTNAFFYTTTFGSCYRQASISSDPEEIKDWFNEELMLGGPKNEYTKWSYRALEAACRSSQYISPILMWESIYDANSIDTVVFVADKDYKNGDEICVRSRINNYPMWLTAPKDLTKNEKLTFTDYVQNRFFVGGGGFTSSGLIGAPVFMTKGALNFTAPPTWYRVFFTGDTTEQVTNMCMSEDGNFLFVSTFSSSSTYHNIYRISGFDLARDSMTLSYGKPTSSGTVNVNPNCLLDVAKVYSTNSFITSISLDPQNNDVLVVTIGGSNLESHIYASTNATSGATLDLDANPKDGTGLPSGNTPVYTALVEMNNSDLVFIGTEKGIYVTDNFSGATPVWEVANDGIDAAIPVFMLKQQTKNYPEAQAKIYGDDTNDITIIDFEGVRNTGCIYAATHGRGIFRNITYDPDFGIPEKPIVKNSTISVYPNPTNDAATIKFTLSKNVSNVHLSLYDISGKRILSQYIGPRQQGANIEQLDCSTLQSGIYFIRLQGDTQTYTSKIVVTK